MTTGAWSGYYLPVAGPYNLTAQRIRCETPANVAAGSNQLLSRVAAATATGQIALTFDLGGRTAPALDIVERLILDRVCATIFPTGATAATAAGTAILRLIAAHPELFELGNHTDHHCNLRDGGGGSACPADRPVRVLHRVRARRRRRDLRGEGRPELDALLATAVRRARPRRSERRRRRRLHQDLHVGHRHDRLATGRERPAGPDARRRSPRRWSRTPGRARSC